MTIVGKNVASKYFIKPVDNVVGFINEEDVFIKNVKFTNI